MQPFSLCLCVILFLGALWNASANPVPAFLEFDTLYADDGTPGEGAHYDAHNSIAVLHDNGTYTFRNLVFGEYAVSPPIPKWLALWVRPVTELRGEVSILLGDGGRTVGERELSPPFYVSDGLWCILVHLDDFAGGTHDLQVFWNDYSQTSNSVLAISRITFPVVHAYNVNMFEPCEAGTDIWLHIRANDAVVTHDLEFTVDSGETWQPIISGEFSDDSVKWTLPGESTYGCRIRYAWHPVSFFDGSWLGESVSSSYAIIQPGTRAVTGFFTTVNADTMYRPESDIALDSGTTAMLMNNGAWVGFENVDFASGLRFFVTGKARISTDHSFGMAFFLDSLGGRKLAEIGTEQGWYGGPIGDVEGIHDIYMRTTVIPDGELVAPVFLFQPVYADISNAFRPVLGTTQAHPELALWMSQKAGVPTLFVKSPAKGLMTIDILTLKGQRVTTLWDGMLGSGVHPLTLSPLKEVPPGRYLVQVRSAATSSVATISILH